MAENNLFEELKARKIAAFKSRDMVTKGLIDTLVGEIDRNPNYRPKITDGVKSAPSDKIILETIRKMVKNLSTIDTEESKAEVAILEEFLPTQMSEEEIEKIVGQLIESTGADNPSKMGMVMGAFQKQYAGKADNKIVSTKIREKLSEIAAN